jgi:DNA-binding response OmpR family regulator
VQVVSDGPSAFDAAIAGGIDLLVLDLGLPGMDGLEVCRRLRQSGRGVPVLMLTARADEVDFVVGLDAGADDYVAKPFRLAELMARIRALLRRRAPGTLEVNGVRVDLAARRVTVDGGEIEVWNDPDLKGSKTLDMHMSWLRRKLSDGTPNSAEKRIATVRGRGFRFNAD